jgi:hypothetical protein
MVRHGRRLADQVSSYWINAEVAARFPGAGAATASAVAMNLNQFAICNLQW